MVRVVAVLVLLAAACWLAWDRPWSSTSPGPLAPDATDVTTTRAPAVPAPRAELEPVRATEVAAPLALPREATTSERAAGADEPTCVLEFTVVDQAERPVVGASVRVHAGGDDWRDTPVRAEARSDVDGHVTVALPEALRDDHAVEIVADGFYPWRHASDDWPPLAGRTHTLTARALVTGVVRDAASLQPVSGAVVRWKDTEPMTTGSDGRYAVTMPRGQLGGVIVVHPDYPVVFTGYEPCPSFDPRDPPVEYDILLEREAPLDLLVVDRLTGAPLEGVTLRYWEWLDVAVTDAHGRVAHALSARLVDFRKEGYVTLRWRPEDQPLPRDRTLRVPLQPLAWVQGRTVDPAGRPLGGVEVSRRIVSGEIQLVGTHPHSSSEIEATRIALDALPGLVEEVVVDGGSASSAADGSFRLGVRPGPEGCVLRASLDGRVSVASARVPLTEPYATAHVELVLQRGGRLELSVLQGQEHARRGYVIIEDAGGTRLLARQTGREPLLTPQLPPAVRVTVYASRVVVAELDVEVIVGETTPLVIQLDDLAGS